MVAKDKASAGEFSCWEVIHPRSCHLHCPSRAVEADNARGSEPPGVCASLTIQEVLRLVH
jgi:hypothetical protein